MLDNFSTGYRDNLRPFPDITIIEGDMRNKETVVKAMYDVEIVFHLAAAIGNVRSIEQPFYDCETNVLGTLNVLEAARKSGVNRVVYSSSAAIFGGVQYMPIDEAHPDEPDSPYGVSKLAAEKYCLCYSRLYDMEIICLRYFNVYGINQYFDFYGNVIPIFAKKLSRQEPLMIYGNGEQTRDFVNVSDVVKANLLAAQADGISGVFNIGSGEATTINQLAQIMQEVLDRKVDVNYAPTRKGEVRHSRADISAARRALGYEPSVTLIDGLQEYFTWFRAIKKVGDSI